MTEPAWTTIDCTGIEFLIRYRLDGVVMEFEVFDIAGRNSDGTPLFFVEDPMDYVEDPEKTLQFAEGQIKWDGCCDVNIGVENGVMMHGCCREDMSRIGDLFEVLYDIAGHLMPEHAVEYLGCTP